MPAAALEAYLRQCQSGPMLAMSQALHEARPPVPPPVAARAPAARAHAARPRYTVKKGDSLHGIARRNACDVQALARANGVRAPKYLIRPGQHLSLSGCKRG